jgi:hypothetical protein
LRTWEDVVIGETALGTLHLYPGEVSTEEGVVRGEGWAYIQETTDLTLRELDRILTAEETVEGYEIRFRIVRVSDRITYLLVRSGPPDQPKMLILKIVGDTIVASATQEYEDPIEWEEAAENVAQYLLESGASAIRTIFNQEVRVYLSAIAGEDTVTDYDNIALADRAAFGESLIKAHIGGEASSDEIESYISNLEAADENDNIRNFEGLYTEFIDTHKQFTGQSGEVERALSYAEDGWDVEVEPGNGYFDLFITQSDDTEFIEIKTRSISDNFTEAWVLSQIRRVNTKYNNAQSDNSSSSINITRGDVILELNVRNPGVSQADAEATIDLALDTYDGDITADEIRVVLHDGTIYSESIK